MIPMLMESLFTKRVFVVTRYKDNGNGMFEALQKYDVTEQFDALVERQLGTCEMLLLERYDGMDPHYRCTECNHENYENDMPSYCPNCGRKVEQ